jgi:hypothetical protein
MKPNMAEIEGILARHSQSPYVRGQLNVYIFLYFPSKNLVKNRRNLNEKLNSVFCLGLVLNFNYYLFKRCDI